MQAFHLSNILRERPSLAFVASIAAGLLAVVALVCMSGAPTPATTFAVTLLYAKSSALLVCAEVDNGFVRYWHELLATPLQDLAAVHELENTSIGALHESLLSHEVATTAQKQGMYRNSQMYEGCATAPQRI